MNNLSTLYRFELKKLCQRKLLWISLAILTAVSVFLPAYDVIGKMYISSDVTGLETQVYSHYEIIQRRRTDPAGLDGRPLDTALIQEVIDELGVVWREAYTNDSGAEHSVTVQQADPVKMGWTLDGYVIQLEYWDIYDTVEYMAGTENMNASMTAEDYYEAIDAAREQDYANRGLADGAKAWWAEQTENIELPLTIAGYADGGWTSIAQSAFVVNLCVFLFTIIALAGLYPVERLRRTDALVLSAKNGKAPVYLAKYLAGLTVSFVGAAVLLGAMAASSLILLGPEDAHAAVQQLMAPAYGAPMTVRKLALILCGLYLAAGLTHGAFVLTVSIITRGGASAMAVSFGAMMLAVLVPALPDRWEAISQLWSLLPGTIGGNGLLYDSRLVRLGRYLTNYQAAPILWAALISILLALGLALYRRALKT